MSSTFENNMIKKEQRNNSIDVFRYICAIMVVCIHSHPFYEFSPQFSYIVSNIFPRIAVPFFFCISGFYFFQHIADDKEYYKKYINRLLLTYSIWSLIYLSLQFVSWRGGQQPLSVFLMQSIKNFVIYGVEGHLWFFPALIFSVIIATIIYLNGFEKVLIPSSIILYIIGVLGGSYTKIGSAIPILNVLYGLDSFDTIRRIFLMGYPFFVSGLLINKYKSKIMNVSSKKMTALLSGSFVLWIIEIALILKNNLGKEIIITFGLYFLLLSTVSFLIRNPLPQYVKLGYRCRHLANFTYYSHIFFGILITHFLGDISPTLYFILIIIIPALICTMIMKINNKYLNLLIR